jgi:hypothetical protein
MKYLLITLLLIGCAPEKEYWEQPVRGCNWWGFVTTRKKLKAPHYTQLHEGVTIIPQGGGDTTFIKKTKYGTWQYLHSWDSL